MTRKPLLSCSIALVNDVVINTGETAWTPVDSECTCTADASYYKRGTKSAKMQLAAGASVGIQAYGTSAVTDFNLTTGEYTHLKYWVRSTKTLTAGQFRVGLSNVPDASGTEYYVDMPAIRADRWTRVVSPLSPDMLANINSGSSIHLYQAVDVGACSIYIDDVRLCRYDVSPADGIEPAETCEFDNANAVTDRIPELWHMPFRCGLLTVYEVPQDVSVKPYLMTADRNPDEAIETGIIYLLEGQTATDLLQDFDAVLVCLSEDLGDGDRVAIGAREV